MPDTTLKPETGSVLDKFLGDNLALIQKIQTNYAATHNGRFWQGLLTPDDPPDELAKTKAPTLTKKPTDQASSWGDQFKGLDVLPATWPAQVSIDVYDGPKGTGYTITLRVKEGGKIQKRTWNYGPEKEREDKDWVAVETAKP